MSVRALSHVAIGVRDTDRALEFYRDVLGLAVTADRVEEFAQRADTRRRSAAPCTCGGARVLTRATSSWTST